jgi:hypothetical protein
MKLQSLGCFAPSGFGCFAAAIGKKRRNRQGAKGAKECDYQKTSFFAVLAPLRFDCLPGGLPEKGLPVASEFLKIKSVAFYPVSQRRYT